MHWVLMVDSQCFYERSNGMENGLRYTMTHIGDIALDKLAKGCQSVAKTTRGIVLTYDIHEQGRKKNKIIHRIGNRMAELKAFSPEHDIFIDAKLKDLFDQLNGIETLINSHLKEREERLYPCQANNNCEA
jgi:hypothetical protein